MKKLAVISIGIMVGIMLVATNGFAEEKLKFAAVENVPPFTLPDDGSGVVKGMAIDIFKEVAKRMGFEAEISALPFKRLWLYLQQGELDGAIQIYYNPDRLKYIIYSDPPGYYVAHYIFVKKGNEGKFKSGTVEALYGKTVAKERGFFVTKEFEQAVNDGKITVDEAQNTELNLKKLLMGRTDAYVSNYHIALYNIKKYGFQGQIVPLSEPLTPKKGTFMAISKQSKNIPDVEEFAKRFSATLKEIHTDGTLEKITANYIK
jgi:polar amino acid transport system substrate-binding protein